MDKITEHLQQHLSGEVISTDRARDYFSTDGSIFKIEPKLIVYPRNSADVRKLLRFSWQLGERGKTLPITARGKGTDQAGAALGEGIVLVFPAHMKRLMEMDTESVTVQPGIIYSSLQNTLHTHGRFLPPYPSSIDFASIGGAVANNSSGEKTVKYGSTRNYVESVELVLANGELINTGRISKRELDKKKGLASFEGEIYRQLDGIIEDNRDLIESSRPIVSKHAAGYDLWDVKQKDDSFDLTPLIVGSQGTLGVVTKIKLKTEKYNPNTTLIVAHFDSIEEAGEAVLRLQTLTPSALEVVDDNLLKFAEKHQPKSLHGVIEAPFPKIVLLIEFDDASDSKQKTKVKKAKKMLSDVAREYQVTDDNEEQEQLWRIRHSAASSLSHVDGSSKPLPIIEDGVVPADQLPTFLNSAYKLFKEYNLEVAVWGHAGDGNLHMQPFMDLSQVGDRQKVFNIMDDFYEMVIKLGGSTCGEHNDGRLRGGYLPDLFGKEMYDVFVQVKAVFDPYKFLNPGVKIGVDKSKLKDMMRDEYSMDHLYDHMPGSK